MQHSNLNTKLLKDVTDCAPDEEMEVLANGNGEQDYFQIGTDVHMNLKANLNKDSIANIIAMADTTAKYRVTMDTEAHGTAIFVHISDDKVMKFEQCGQGLYYFDTKKKSVEHKVIGPVNQYMFVSIVRENKKHFSRQEVERADKASFLQQNLNWPSNPSCQRTNFGTVQSPPKTSIELMRFIVRPYQYAKVK